MQPGDDESDLHPRQRFPGVPVPFIAALWELVSKGINAVFIQVGVWVYFSIRLIPMLKIYSGCTVLQGGGGFVIQRPKEFIAHCLERFESLNMVDTFTRQVNLYQFAYVPTSSVSRHKLWESNTLGAIGACCRTVACFACSLCVPDSFQTNDLVMHCLFRQCTLTHAASSLL
jgi:hypothetical protein